MFLQKIVSLLQGRIDHIELDMDEGTDVLFCSEHLTFQDDNPSVVQGGESTYP